MRSAARLWGGLLMLALAACWQQAEAPVAPAVVSPAEQGRVLYERGLGASGQPVMARVGAGSIQVPATEMPCINCHGPDGRGRPEGGVAPSNLRWDSLTRPYEVVEGSGRRHPAYDARLFGRAIALGVDSAGNELSDAMPRYQLSHEALAGLIAHLQALGTQADPGLSEKELRVGTVVSGQEDSQAARAALAAYFEALNQRGGLYGRRLTLGVVEAAASPEGRVEAVRRLLEQERPFVLAHVVLGNGDDGVSRMLEAQQVPLVGALSLHPATSSLRKRYIFHLYGGILEQARALVASAATARLENRRVAIIHPPGDEALEEARRVEDSCVSAALGPVEKHVLEEGRAAALVSTLARKAPGVVLFLDSASVREFRKKAALARWNPLFLVPGGLLTEEPGGPGQAGRLRVAFPSSPEVLVPAALEEYRQLAASYGLPEKHLSAQLSALASAKILVEGLKRAGRELSREALVRSLEGMHDFRTELTPPISYGKERRIGALGAYVFELDAKGRQAAPGWVKLVTEQP